jgi:hypothetical protein
MAAFSPALNSLGTNSLPGVEEQRVGVTTARDRMWIFTVEAGLTDDYLEAGGVRGGSRMTPAEGAFYLNLPNLIFVRADGRPPLPKLQGWRSKATFDQYAISFRPLQRVVWSIGSSSGVEQDELLSVLSVAGRFPNIVGVYLDDFFTQEGKAMLSTEKLAALRERLNVPGRKLEVWSTLYTHQLNYPLASYLELFDVTTLWTWNSDELKDLEGNLEKLEKIRPRTRKGLGCYMWDFLNHRPVSVRQMELQCKAGLEWLTKGRVSHMIFLASSMCDVGLEVVDWTRQWIQQAGKQRLG